ncbi:MAG: transglycosylase SLT domain-containing protein [Actinomycetota bacterium]
MLYGWKDGCLAIPCYVEANECLRQPIILGVIVFLLVTALQYCTCPLNKLTYATITDRLRLYMIVFQMPYRITTTIIVILLVFTMLGSTALASPLDEKRQELKNIDAQIKATKDKQNSAAKRQAEILQQIQQSNQKMVEMQRRLNGLQAELNKNIAQRKNVEAMLNATQKKLDEMQAELAAAQAKLALWQNLFKKRVVSAYKNRNQNILVILLSSRNLLDLVERVAILYMVAEQDGKLVLKIKQQTANITSKISIIEATKEAINRQRLSLIAKKERIEALTSSIISQQKQLQNEMNRQRQLYAQIQQERIQLGQTEKSLREYADKLAKQIMALEKQNKSMVSAMRIAGIPDDLINLAANIANKYGIPPRLFFALITQESGWNYRAVSGAGAIGLTQIMPFNIIAMGYDIETFKNSPSQQLEAGARYLSQQYRTFGRWDYALAAYNAGPGAVMAYGGIPPYSETRRYVRNILAMAGMTN